MTEWWSHDHKPAAPSSGGAAGYDRRNVVDTDEGTEPGARAVSRSVPGVGVELRFIWNDDTRSTQIYRNVLELAAAASQEREDLIGRRLGRRTAPLGAGAADMSTAEDLSLTEPNEMLFEVWRRSWGHPGRREPLLGEAGHRLEQARIMLELAPRNPQQSQSRTTNASSLAERRSTTSPRGL